jgi:hypothetical protein
MKEITMKATVSSSAWHKTWLGTMLATALLVTACGGGGGGGGEVAAPPPVQQTPPANTPPVNIPPVDTPPVDTPVAETKAWLGASLLEQLNGTTASSPQIAVAPGGDAIAVWVQSNQPDGSLAQIWANQYVVNVGWLGAKVIPMPDLGGNAEPQVAMDIKGNAIAVWVQSVEGQVPVVLASHFSASSGSWEMAVPVYEGQTIGVPSQPKLVVTALGDAMVVWRQTNGNLSDIYASRYASSNDQWRTFGAIEANDAGSAKEPQVAVDRSGNVIVVWEHANKLDEATARTDIYANRYIASGANQGWVGERAIEKINNGSASNPQIAMDTASGNAVVTWLQTDGVRKDLRSNLFSFAEAGNTAGGWGLTPALVEKDDTNSVNQHQISYKSAQPVVVWTQSTKVLLSRFNRTTGGWTDAELVGASENSSIPLSVTLAEDLDANALVLWVQSVSGRATVLANRFRAGIGWGGVTAIDGGALAGPALIPRVAMDAKGNALAVWQQLVTNSLADIWGNIFTEIDPPGTERLEK